MAGNQAVEINSSGASIAITDHGSDWYWTVFCIFALMSLIHAGMGLFQWRGGKKFYSYLHVGPIIVSAVLTYTYFTLASNLGNTNVAIEFNHITDGNDEREVFYARYIGWFLAYFGLLYTFEMNAQSQHVATTFDLLQVFHNLILQVSSFEVFVLGLLIGALIPSTYKWGYWTFAVSAQLFGLALLLQRQLFGSVSAKSTLNFVVMSFFSVCFILYPVCWGLSEGGNVIQPDSEAVFYGVLDLVVFWLVPIVTVFDSFKNGSYIEDAAVAATTGHDDVEKQIHNDTPEMRASGETEVPPQTTTEGTTA